MANLEALWIGRQLRPGKKIVASQQAHYTHARICNLLRVEFETVPSDCQARLDVQALSKTLSQGNVGLVVATVGTTATGSVDLLSDILELRDRYKFVLHVDAAYGGYFGLADNLSGTARKTFDRLGEADSIAIDPHKHGLQPYGCGCILFRDPAVQRFYRHDSPYTYFTSDDLHLGEISFECSRPGAAAVALWATQKLLPLVRSGEFAAMLSRSRAAALKLYERLAADSRWLTNFAPELDIVTWVPNGTRISQMSEHSRRIFTEAARHNLHLALADLPVKFFDLNGKNIEVDSATVTCLRSVLMKPEHLDWVDAIWDILQRVM